MKRVVGQKCFLNIRTAVMRLLLLLIALAILILLSLFQSKKEGNESREIPLHIYQTWKTKELPEKMKESVNRLKEKNPDFEYHLFDDNDCYEFIKANFEEDVAKAYQKVIPGAYKADLWRYCVLYVNGGVYLDIKYSNVGDFNLIDLTDKEYFMADIEQSGAGIYNAFMICKAGNAKLKKVIEMTTRNILNEAYVDGCLGTTGPVLLRKCFTDEEFERIKSNGLGICRYNENTSICLNGKPILTTYDEYYKTERGENKQPSYCDMWHNKMIYKKD